MKLNNDANKEITPRILSSVILKESGQIIIEHNGEEYMFRITRGKLILTKQAQEEINDTSYPLIIKKPFGSPRQEIIRL